MAAHIKAQDEAMNQLRLLITKEFQENGVLDQVREKLQSAMAAMMRGEGKLSEHRSASGAGVGKPEHNTEEIKILNQLILEYFQWHGFYHSAEMFVAETGVNNVVPVRECLEGVVGRFEHPRIPILLEMVAKLKQKKDYSNSQGQSANESGDSKK